jgi:MerR family transcriptional regulator, light-induced transcriptional regulator
MSRAHSALDKHKSDYLRAVLNKDKSSAEEVMLKMIGEGLTLGDVYQVLGRAEVEVGSLWEKGSITVSDEHYATDVTIDCVSMAADRLRTFRRESAGFAYLSPTDGEFHDVGLRMLSELLRSNGWDTELRLSGTLQSALKALAVGRRVDLFCLSATMPSNVPRVTEAVRALRKTPAFYDTKILVGGAAFEDKEARESIVAGSEQTGLVDYLASNLFEALEFARSISNPNPVNHHLGFADSHT